MKSPITCALLIGLIGVPVLSSCGGGSGGGEVSSASRSKTLDDFQYSKEDVMYGEAGSDTEGMIVGGRRSSFEGKRQVAFGGEFDKKVYSAQTYQAGQWAGNKAYQTQNYAGSTDASRYRTSSQYNAQGAREGAQQSNYSGRSVETGTYATGVAREGELIPLDSPESIHASQRYDQPRIIPYRDYQRMTIEETNAILGKE